VATALYLPSITVDAVIEALTAFLTPFVPAGCPIIRGWQNRVPPPFTPAASDPLAFLKLSEVNQVDLETPTFTQSIDSSIQQASVLTPTRIDIQIDFYGLMAGDYCKAVKAVFRSPYAPDQFPDGIAPLYCSDGIRGALVTGEDQYEDRWLITGSFQYNPIVIVPQQSALVITANTEDYQ
jgi:hypothetical protein